MNVSAPLDVVVVDDESSVGTLCELNFRKSIKSGDVRLHYFTTAKECLNYLATTDRHPGSEVLLTDINMPEVSGYELLQKVKQKYPSIDVYMMSAYDDELSIRKSLSLGAQGYFTKPVNYKDLKFRISEEYGVPLT
ncbi:response regulator [uncultured Bdellovibrio sp.]|uniref:response regulator n=1 Tax=Bdellovibrio sp. HCB-162 TaxID=3394234 RepID=UPI0025CD2FC6|nr:response regulator [uncultured Bdellovibrio sp.]